LKELAESLNGKGNNHGTVHPKVCDVTDEQAVKNVFSWVDSTLGGVSILINNAGTAKLSSLLSEKKYIIFIINWFLFIIHFTLLIDLIRWKTGRLARYDEFKCVGIKCVLKGSLSINVKK